MGNNTNDAAGGGNGALKAKVEEAITKVLDGGQRYKIGSRSLDRADLGELRKLKAELEATDDGADEAGGLGNTYVARFDRR